MVKGCNGLPIGVAHEKPILDTQVYEVEYMDGEKTSLSANYIAEKLFAQIDDDGNRQVLMDEIINYHANGVELKQQDAFILKKVGTKC